MLHKLCTQNIGFLPIYMVDSCHLFNHIVPGWFTGTVIVSEIIQSMDKIDLGPVSLTVSPSQFKFDGNSISLSPRFLYSDCYKILYMARQLCCRGMCKILLRSDGQQRNYGKAKFPSNLNCGQKNVSETGPCIKWWHWVCMSCVHNSWDEQCITYMAHDIC